VDRQKEFDELNSLDYPLLSDPDRVAHTLFGTKRLGKLPGKRATFVVDQDRRIVKEIRSETSMVVHAEGALAALRELAES